MSGMVFLILSIATGALGQVFFKLGVGGSELSGIAFFLSLVKSGWVWLGGLSYGVSFALWMLVLKEFDLSYARPLTSAGYILTYVLAMLFLGESFTWRRMAATGLITAGVLLMK